jgi:hypothetical protein
MLVNTKTILSTATFLLINLLLSSSYADSNIAALGDLNGIYVNLKINDRTPQGVPKQRIDKKKLLKYVEKELINTIGKERGIRLFKSIDPHLNVKIIIEGQEHHAVDRLTKYMYHVTVEASLERNTAEWHREHTESWTENTKSINVAKKRVKAASNSVIKAKKDTIGKPKNSFAYSFLKVYKTNLINAKKNLANTIERYAIRRTAEGMLKKIALDLVRDYRVAKNIEDEYKKREQEIEELSNQLGYEETISLQQKDEDVVQSTNRNIYTSTLTTYKSGDHVHNILKDQPDDIKIIDSQMFKDYVNNLPRQQLGNAIRIKESGTEEEIIQLVSNYKSQEEYQESHRLMINEVIDNYNVFDESIAISILQDWINKEGDSAKVIRLSIDNNSSNRFVQTYLVTYTITKGSGQQKYMYEYTPNTKSTRKMVYMHNED